MDAEKLFSVALIPIGIWLLIFELTSWRLKKSHNQNFEHTESNRLAIAVTTFRIIWTSEHKQLNSRLTTYLVYLARFFFVLGSMALCFVFFVVLQEFGSASRE